MSSFRRTKQNPIELIGRYWPSASVGHITYDENLKMRKGDFDIVRQCGGDGTLLFTIEMLQKVLINPLNMESHCTRHNVDFKQLKSINYTIGPIYHSTVFGRIELKSGGTFPGQRERARMPVICEYIYKDAENGKH